MRRAQSVRNHMGRPSLALAADDLGVLREGDESNEDVLRKQLVEKDRECDKLNMTIAALRQQLELRPPVEEIRRLKEEQQSLDVLMLGYQRENEKSMAIIEQYKSREKLLERELHRLAGDNWRSALEIPSSALASAGPAIPRTGTLSRHHRSNTISTTMSSSSSPYSSHSPYGSMSHSFSPEQEDASWMGDTTIGPNMGMSMSMSRSRSPSPTMRRHQKQQSRQKSARQEEDQEGDSSNDQRSASAQRDAAAAAQLEQQRHDATVAQIEQLRVFMLGIEKRLDGRAERLARTLEKAESEGRRYEEAQAVAMGHAGGGSAVRAA